MRILTLVHGYPPTAVAGTELCAQRLCVGLKDMGHELSVITREELHGSPEYKMFREQVDDIPVLRIVNNFTRLQKRYFYDYHPRIEEIVEEELSRVKPDLVHVQHLAGASWGVPGMVKKRGIPLVVSLHDYWYACERVQLLRPDGTICPGPDDGRNCALYCAHNALSFMAAAVCERVKLASGMMAPLPGERALLSAFAPLQRLLMRRRTRRLETIYGDRCGRLLRPLGDADLLISPSEKSKSVYTAMGVPSDRHVVIPHGLPEAAPAGAAADVRDYDGRRPLVVGYVGNIMAHKGVVTLLRAVKRLPPHRVRVKMYGRSYPPRFARYIERLVRRFPEGQVRTHGAYRPADLAGIFAGLDLLVIPSPWHETFNLVLWESWSAGLPVIASRVGALADFVREGVDGLGFPPGSWKELRAAIERVADKPELLSALRRSLPRRCLTLEASVARYEELYRGLVQS